MHMQVCLPPGRFSHHSVISSRKDQGNIREIIACPTVEVWECVEWTHNILEGGKPGALQVMDANPLQMGRLRPQDEGGR